MTPDYASLDAAIVKAIRAGVRTHASITMWIRAYDIWGARDVHRRLPSLRKRGLIVYNNGRWSAVEKV